MRRREAALEQQAHRVALVAEGRLDADEDIAEALAEHEQAGAVGLLAAGRRAPLRLDLLQVPFPPHVVVGRDAHVHVGRGAVAFGVAMDDRLAQRVDVRRQRHRVAGTLHRRQCVVQRLEHRQERRGAGVARVRREVEDHRRHLARRPLGAPQVDQLADPRRQHVGALDAAVHVVRAGAVLEAAAVRAAGAGDVRGAAAAAVDHRAGGAVELGDRDHHRRLDRQQPARRAAPLVERLELHRRDGEVGHVQPRQDVLGGARVVVGRPADEREAGQRHQRVDRRPGVVEEEGFDRRAGVEPGREGRQHAQAACLQRGDHAVVVLGVAGQQVGAQQQHADGAPRAAGRDARQRGRRFGEAGARAVGAARQPRVVDAELGVLDRRVRLRQAAQRAARAVGIAVDEEMHQVGDVLLGAGQPVLQREEVGPHVLRGAGDEAQDLRQPAQHLHLLRAGAGLDRLLAALGARLAGVAAQPLQQRHRAAGRRVHAEAAEPRQLRHLGGGHRADHRVAMLAPRAQRGQHRQEVLFHEQHRDDHDVGAADVGDAARERGGVVAPFGGGVHVEAQAGQGARQRAAGALGGARDMRVHRHQHDACGRGGRAGVSG